MHGLPGHTAFVKRCKKSVKSHFPPCTSFIQVTCALMVRVYKAAPLVPCRAAVIIGVQGRTA